MAKQESLENYLRRTLKIEHPDRTSGARNFDLWLSSDVSIGDVRNMVYRYYTERGYDFYGYLKGMSEMRFTKGNIKEDVQLEHDSFMNAVTIGIIQ